MLRVLRVQSQMRLRKAEGDVTRNIRRFSRPSSDLSYPYYSLSRSSGGKHQSNRPALFTRDHVELEMDTLGKQWSIPPGRTRCSNADRELIGDWLTDERENQ